MLVNAKSQRTIWLKPDDPACVEIIDQRRLPHELVTEELRSVEDAVIAIRDMHVRGAPLIGATAAWGMYLSVVEQGDGFNLNDLHRHGQRLQASRPTAVNLAWAVNRVYTRLESTDSAQLEQARTEAEAICDEDVEVCRKIGKFGLGLIEDIAKRKNGEPVNILTHCNAGWLATVDWGTATSPIYQAQQQGIALHVWVDETRPRNQGANLTAWEMVEQGIDHSVIVDNAGGHLMQKGMVDLVIVGTDRTARNGDVANKIGTYLKALAAQDTGVPFYVALPSPTIDWSLANGCQQIPIEERDGREVTHISGYLSGGKVGEIRITPAASHAANPAFDVTPARLIDGLITERGICPASESGLLGLFPEQYKNG
ncbi:MAG: S-methyl-5-thioribose-1-phosphate isomerase [Gammaproteobacteria bacterium]|nr:S-methyl-5-thioribose-1-phosphate isomerase [Gammaproteobacteria bacterium]